MTGQVSDNVSTFLGKYPVIFLGMGWEDGKIPYSLTLAGFKRRPVRVVFKYLS